MYVDTVEFRSGARSDEIISGYLDVEIIAGWITWRWSDKTVRMPADQIACVTTHEE